MTTDLDVADGWGAAVPVGRASNGGRWPLYGGPGLSALRQKELGNGGVTICCRI